MYHIEISKGSLGRRGDGGRENSNITGKGNKGTRRVKCNGVWKRKPKKKRQMTKVKDLLKRTLKILQKFPKI